MSVTVTHEKLPMAPKSWERYVVWEDGVRVAALKDKKTADAVKAKLEAQDAWRKNPPKAVR